MGIAQRDGRGRTSVADSANLARAIAVQEDPSSPDSGVQSCVDGDLCRRQPCALFALRDLDELPADACQRVILDGDQVEALRLLVAFVGDRRREIRRRPVGVTEPNRDWQGVALEVLELLEHREHRLVFVDQVFDPIVRVVFFE